MGLTSKEVYNSLGVAHKGLEDIEMAKKMFNQALDLDSNFDLAQKNLDSLQNPRPKIFSYKLNIL